MTRYIILALVCAILSTDATGRGFGGGGGGGYRGGAGGFDRGSYGGGGFSSFSGDRGSYSGDRSFQGYQGFDRSAGSGSYDHTWTGNNGWSVNTEGNRGYYNGPRVDAAGGNRDTTVTSPTGKTWSDDTSRGAATGWRGNTVAGRSTDISTPKGDASWNSAFAGNRYTGNAAHYSSFNAAGVNHSTSYWSAGYVHTQAGYVRGGFGYYGCFNPGWYARYPGCWFAAGWAAGAAWNVATWPMLGGYCGITAAPIDYDYGTTTVITNNNVYTNGQDQGTVQQYAQQASNIAAQGQASTATPQDDWKPLGVFALASGTDKTSNNIFQLAVNKDGVIRGNYYDGIMDTTTEVYGSVDKAKQLACWTIGKKNDRVFEAGIYNLTQDECPCLVHLGNDKTTQMLLVRVQQPKQ